MGLFGSGKKSAGASGGGGSAVLPDGRQINVAAHIDCLGDSCPRPQLMTKKALAAANASDIIEVAVDNPTSMEALPPMCPQLSSTYLDTVKQAHGWHVYIQKN